MLTPTLADRVAKTAADNGFDLPEAAEAGWLGFTSTLAPVRIWVTSPGAGLILALSRADVADGLDGARLDHPLPADAHAGLLLADLMALHRALRRVLTQARTLPNALLATFEDQARALPRSTEAERLVVQRVGQSVFRDGLLDFWEKRCAISGLAVPALLRASHIKPWAECTSDAERLDVYNGLLLAPHLDAAFDQGLITVLADGVVVVAAALDAEARALLGLDRPLRLRGLRPSHERYLTWHRAHLFER